MTSTLARRTFLHQPRLPPEAAEVEADGLRWKSSSKIFVGFGVFWSKNVWPTGKVVKRLVVQSTVDQVEAIAVPAKLFQPEDIQPLICRGRIGPFSQ